MQCFLKLKSSIWFLARQALLIRGDGDESTCNLLKLWGEDYAQIFEWLKKKTDKYIYFCRDTKCDVQNSGIAHVKANYQVSWTDIFYYTHGGWDNWYIKQRTDSVLFMFGWLWVWATWRIHWIACYRFYRHKSHLCSDQSCTHSIVYTNEQNQGVMLWQSCSYGRHQIWSSKACLSRRSKNNLHRLLGPCIKPSMWRHHQTE